MRLLLFPYKTSQEATLITYLKKDLPSGWAIFCIAVGATMIGMEMLNPKTLVLTSISLTSLRIRGLNLFFFNIWKRKSNIPQYLNTIYKEERKEHMGSLTESWRRRYDSPEESTDPLHQMHSNHKPSLVVSPLRSSRIPSRSLSPFFFINFCVELKHLFHVFIIKNQFREFTTRTRAESTITTVQ